MKRESKIRAAELRTVDNRIKKREDKHQRRYRAVHGKKVDFIKHWLEENILFVSIRFLDGTNFSIQGITSQAAFYAALFHECGHATGAKHRLNRDAVTSTIDFGSPTYSEEELLSEFVSAMLSGQCGITPTQNDQSASYIQHWLSVLKASDNKKMLAHAISGAQKAVDHILQVKFDAQPETEESPAQVEEKELVAA